ncbi:MAG: phosphoribosylformylglycinamidine synthase subunit PurS [Dehalococcoidia bacterium]|nr:phosphoribosylformylglycinamidine synthase subunit PurS [Dehalococcoidia bacterium]
MAARYLARIDVMLKPLVNDPQGLAVRDGLRSLGFAGVESVRVGKHIEVTLEAASAPTAEQAVRAMCQQLLANQVIEAFEFAVGEAAATEA